MALPETATGASASMTVCVPEAMPSEPVEVGASGCGSVAGADAEPLLADESPSTLMALPSSVIGADTSPTIWLPETIPSDPVVLGASAALAAEMPMSERPPTRRAQYKPLLMSEFMMVVLLNE